MKILVTGGAGFIGSNIVEQLLSMDNLETVRVIDNLSTGKIENIEPFFNHPKFEFIQADITDYDACLNACQGMDAVCHQAALGSVPRSISNPINTNNVNVNGFLNMLYSCVSLNIKTFVFASSSSTYGNNTDSVKTEERTGTLLSPYAVTKAANELYASVFSSVYNMKCTGLRYFNVFGPRQNPEGPYAAVIPLFINAALENKQPTINGDGSTSRDFTFVSNVVQANISALLNTSKENRYDIFNIACGKSTSLLELWSIIKQLTQTEVTAIHGPERQGDIKNSLANIDKAAKTLNYQPYENLTEQLEKTIAFYKKKITA